MKRLIVIVVITLIASLSGCHEKFDKSKDYTESLEKALSVDVVEYTIYEYTEVDDTVQITAQIIAKHNDAVGMSAKADIEFVYDNEWQLISIDESILDWQYYPSILLSEGMHTKERLINDVYSTVDVVFYQNDLLFYEVEELQDYNVKIEDIVSTESSTMAEVIAFNALWENDYISVNVPMEAKYEFIKDSWVLVGVRQRQSGTLITTSKTGSLSVENVKSTFEMIVPDGFTLDTKDMVQLSFNSGTITDAKFGEVVAKDIDLFEVPVTVYCDMGIIVADNTFTLTYRVDQNTLIPVNVYANSSTCNATYVLPDLSGKIYTGYYEYESKVGEIYNRNVTITFLEQPTDKYYTCMVEFQATSDSDKFTSGKHYGELWCMPWGFEMYGTEPIEMKKGQEYLHFNYIDISEDLKQITGVDADTDLFDINNGLYLELVD